MSGLIDKSGRGEPVAVSDDCPECGSGETVTSAFGARECEAPYSAWCETCGYGFYADALDTEGSA